MNIQSEKLELVRMILDTNNPDILNSVRKLFKIAGDTDFWEKLTQAERDDILQGIREIESGVTLDYEDIMKKYR